MVCVQEFWTYREFRAPSGGNLLVKGFKWP